MRHPEHLRDYLMQYRRVPHFLGMTYDPFLGERVLNHLLDRDAMEGDPDLVTDLISCDGDLSIALSKADCVWWESLQRWATQCGFAQSLWWIAVQYNARRGLTGPLSLVDVMGPLADAWVKAFGDRLSVSEHRVRIDTIVSNFHSAMLVGVAQDAGFVRERITPGPRLPKDLSRFAQASPAIVLPGSVVIGFQLPRDVPGEPASGPAGESLRALDVVMTASERYAPDKDDDLIADVVDDEANRKLLWGSLKGIYNAAAEAERVEIVSGKRGSERTVTWPVHGKAVSIRREARQVTLTGNVRAIDLDLHSLKIQAAGSPWTTAVKAEATLFLRIEELAGLVIGQNVVVEGTTKDDAEFPRTMTAIGLTGSGGDPDAAEVVCP